MHLEPDPVAEPVVEAVLEHLARRFESCVGWPASWKRSQTSRKTSAPGDPGADRLERPVERLLAERVVPDDLLRRLADDERARHVRVARRLDVPRPEVDHDRLARADLPGAHVVADRALRRRARR